MEIFKSQKSAKIANQGLPSYTPSLPLDGSWFTSLMTVKILVRIYNKILRIVPLVSQIRAFKFF